MRILTGMCLFIWTARGVLATGAWAATVAIAGSPSDTLDAGRAVQLALARGTDTITADAAWLESRQRVDVAFAQVASAEEHLRGSRRRHRLGNATMLEFVDAQVQAERANEAVIKAQVARTLADAQLPRAVGRAVAKP